MQGKNISIYRRRTGALHFRIFIFLFLCIAFLLLSVMPNSCMAQTGGGITSKNRVDFLAPQVADFMKYGNTPVSYYTGQTGFSIPLFHIKTKEFSIPVTLNYNSAGFKPTSQTGPTGMNWFLSAEGMITRKINGEPDERTANCTNIHPMGYYLGTKNNTSSTDASIWNFTAPYVLGCGFYYMGYEYQQDEFSYNCLGHTGKFYMTYGGNVSVIANEDVKVDLTNFAQQSYSNQIPVASTIVLTMSDGYKFTFGGDVQNLDYSFQMPLPNSLDQNSVITGWHLTKVVSPEGNEVRYVYKSFNPFINNSGTVSDPNFYILNKFINSETTGSYIHVADPSFIASRITDQSSSSEHSTDSYSLTKVAYLDRIESDDFVLSFSYSQKPNKFYRTSTGSADASPYHKEGFQLNGISLSSKKDETVTTPVKQVQFNYSMLGDGFKSRQFLTSIVESGTGTYSFSYYRTNEMPSSYTRSIDHWGFWKGGYDENGGLIPNVSQDANGDQIIGSSLRDPDPTVCNVGMLEKVIYPTGGTTTFVYEPHQYSQRLERRSDQAFLPHLYPVNGIAGGARIRSIKDSANGNPPIIKTFKYNLDNQSNGMTSSGVLLDWPRYIYYWRYESPSIQQYILKIRGSSFHSNYNTAENYINYAEVTEETSGNGSKVMKFTNYVSNPDYPDYAKKDFEPGVTTYIDNKNLYTNYVGLTFNDRFQERGQQIFEGDYDEAKTLLKSVATTYPAFDEEMDYIVSTLNTGYTVQAFKIYTRPYRTTSTSVFTLASPSVTSVKSYTYDNSFHNLRSESTVKSDGKINTRIITYPNDYASGTTFIDQMKTANLSGLPVEEVNYQTEGSNISILSGQVTQYYTGGKGLAELTYKLQTDAPVPLSGFKFSSRATGILPSAGTPEAYGLDSRYQPQLNFTQYDNFGNLKEVIPSFYWKGVPTSYRWGYNGQYPVAEIKNSKVSDVYVQNFENLFEADFDSNSSLDASKSHTGLYANLITNNSSAEKVSHSSQYMSIGSGTPRMFTYSGWVYSDGPTAQIILFMYRAGEPGYYTYVDDVACTQTGKWIYVTKNVLVPADVVSMRLRLDNNAAGHIWFDDLSVRPADSQLTTYTYDPFVGIKSKIEGNGQTTYFTYDQFQRLINIQDQNRQVKKSFGYYYKH